MEENGKNELIVVKQLPIIEENLKKLSLEIDEKVNNALALVCNEKTRKDVKDIRTSLNNQFKELEKQRKYVKNAILEPYNKFEETYKACVSDKFNFADTELKKKIDDVESDLKDVKKKKVVKYFDEYRLSLNIDFVKFEDTNISVDLSATEKKLKNRSKEYLDKLATDLDTIKTLDYSDEILIEYKKSKDLSSAISTVNNRHKELEELQKKKEEQTKNEKVNQAPKARMNFNGGGLYAPKREIKTESDNEMFEIILKVRGSKERLKELLRFLKDGGYDYE